MNDGPRFVLRVMEDNGVMVADDRSVHGGIDALQTVAFSHLCPTGAWDWLWRELLYDLAELHGWDVKITSAEEDR